MTFSDEEKPRFKKIIEEANCILLSTESIQSFPFSVKKVVKEKDFFKLYVSDEQYLLINNNKNSREIIEKIL